MYDHELNAQIVHTVVIFLSDCLPDIPCRRRTATSVSSTKVPAPAMLLLGIFVSVFVPAAAVDLASPEVFDPRFYINTNVEVLRAGVRSAAAAKNHWLTHGIHEGLQACGKFHSVQYLARYSDLYNAFGKDYQRAVEHYLTFGLKENRLGYLEGGYGNRWTVSDPSHGLFVSASRRMGGAIDSLVWNNHEFINAWDHGRELQMAMNFVPHGEAFNPTEGGGRTDSQADSTKTVIRHIHAAGKTLTSEVLPAFWMRANDPESVNVIDTYQYPFSKTVTLSCPGVAKACLVFQSTFTVAGDIPAYTVLQMEAPTGYMPSEFTVFRSVHLTSGQLVTYTNTHPVVASTADDRYAMGVYAPAGQDTDLFQYYGSHSFGSNPDSPSDTNKWNVVYRKNTFPHGSTHVQKYTVYICVGTVVDVVSCINTLRHSTGDAIVG